MIMADKIIEQRKKNGWSQEELAEKLNVSRQSVSKWEGAQSVPDLNKVIAMASIFGVSTDYLLKDDIEELFPVEVEQVHGTDILYKDDEPVRRVSLEEANEYLKTARASSGQTAFGVMLCILSPICMILLSLVGGAGLIPLTEDQGGALGAVILLLIVAAAVYLFVRNGMQLSRFEYLEQENIDTEYGVTGMVKERRQEFEHTHMTSMTIGIILCVLSAVPLFGCAMVNENNDMLSGIGLSLTLILIAVGVWQIVKVSIVWESYEKLLEEGDYSRKSKKVKNGFLAGIYWIVVTAGYLAYSFCTMDWVRSWIVWTVAGVLYAAVLKIEEARQGTHR